jgi:hypothetical protein
MRSNPVVPFIELKLTVQQGAELLFPGIRPENTSANSVFAVIPAQAGILLTGLMIDWHNKTKAKA